MLERLSMFIVTGQTRHANSEKWTSFDRERLVACSTFIFSWLFFFLFHWNVKSAKLGMFVSYLTWECLVYGWSVQVNAGF